MQEDMNSKISQFILVDGDSYLYRAFYGLPPLTNSKGQDTGAIYGFIHTIRSVIKEYEPTHIAVVFDGEGKTFRDNIYSKYKANRTPMPDKLRGQIEPLKQIIRAMGLPLIIEDGVEAKDIIGTLTAKASKGGINTLISTGNRYMAQLVNEHVTLVNSMTRTTMDSDYVMAQFGVPAGLLVDYLALKGDKVDGIPGVPGVSDKSVVAMLNGIGGVHAIYDNLDKIANLSFRGAKIIEERIKCSRDQARLSHQLAAIRLDIDLGYSPAELGLSQYDKIALQKLFKQYEFNRWHQEVTTSLSEEAKQPIINSKDSTRAVEYRQSNERPNTQPSNKPKSKTTQESSLLEAKRKPDTIGWILGGLLICWVVYNWNTDTSRESHPDHNKYLKSKQNTCSFVANEVYLDRLEEGNLDPSVWRLTGFKSAQDRAELHRQGSYHSCMK